MNKKVVLLVEPDERECRSVKAMLESFGYEAIAMQDLEAAVEVYPYVLPDLVLTAHPLPMEGGRDFATNVKRQSPRTLVVGLINRGTLEVVRQALSTGCDDFLSKPVDPELLRKKLRILIGHPDSADGGPEVPVL